MFRANRIKESGREASCIEEKEKKEEEKKVEKERGWEGGEIENVKKVIICAVSL